MPHDPVREETDEWLRKAATDLRAAEALAKMDSELAGTALYHCQQGAEKAIKGYLVFHGQTFRKTHSIGEIGLQAVQLDASLEPCLRLAAPLSDYIWKFRYPGTVFAPPATEIEQGLAAARAVLAAILERLADKADA